jgi:hypothetical protein
MQIAIATGIITMSAITLAVTLAFIVALLPPDARAGFIELYTSVFPDINIGWPRPDSASQ